MSAQTIFPANKRARNLLKGRYYTLEAMLLQNVEAMHEHVEPRPRGKAFVRLEAICSAYDNARHMAWVNRLIELAESQP